MAEMTYEVLPGTQVDNDADGYTEEEGDCDDTQSTISPDGVEIINQLDDDCDGIVDEETDAYDDDGDGFPSKMVTVMTQMGMSIQVVKRKSTVLMMTAMVLSTTIRSSLMTMVMV